MSKIKCNGCGKETDRLVSITQIKDNQKTVVALCRECASTMGFHNPLDQTPFPLAKILQTIIEQSLPPSQDRHILTAACPQCGLTFAQFSQQGRFGCGKCYDTFRPKLESIMRKIHGSSLHRGKYPMTAGEENPVVSVREQERLETEYRRAIESEEFERAASLRDRLREIRAMLSHHEHGEEKS